MGPCASGQRQRPQSKVDSHAPQPTSKHEAKYVVGEDIKVDKAKQDHRKEAKQSAGDNLPSIEVMASDPMKGGTSPLLQNQHEEIRVQRVKGHEKREDRYSPRDNLPKIDIMASDPTKGGTSPLLHNKDGEIQVQGAKEHDKRENRGKDNLPKIDIMASDPTMGGTSPLLQNKHEETQVQRVKEDKNSAKDSLPKIGIMASDPSKKESAPLLQNNHYSEIKGNDEVKKSQWSNVASSKRKLSDEAQRASWPHHDKVNEEIPIDPSPRSFHRIDDLSNSRMQGSIVRKVHQEGITPITQQADYIEADQPQQGRAKRNGTEERVKTEPQCDLMGFSWEERVGKVSILNSNG